MSHRAVMIDIDGVILPIGACTDVEVGLVRTAPDAHLDLVAARVSQEAVACLQGLSERASAKLVVISSLRYAFPDTFIRAFLDRIGLGPHLHKDWFAPFKVSSNKRDDIGFWLDDHRRVKQAFAIDDHDLGLGGKKVRQIMPDGRRGLTRADLKEAAKRWELEALFREQAMEGAR